MRAKLPAMDRATVDVYERDAAAWIARKHRPVPAALTDLAARAHGVVGDLGCGPGWHSAHLGADVVALDAAWSMVTRVRDHAPAAWPVRGDVERLPLRRGALGGVWAHKCYQHLPAERLPLALAELHDAMAVGAPLHLRVTSQRAAPDPDDRFAGRLFACWRADRLHDVVTGAGFAVESLTDDGVEWLDVVATRARTLADTVGPDMRLLAVGLNPSMYAADAGRAFARPGNRFWRAAREAGVVTREHDPYHALRVDGLGLTDLVKRATARADALGRDEYRAGIARVARLVEWLRPGAVCFVGLTGYRVAVDRRAAAGWQPAPFGGRPCYVMPNPSGVNGHASAAVLAAHLAAAAAGP